MLSASATGACGGLSVRSAAAAQAKKMRPCGGLTDERAGCRDSTLRRDAGVTEPRISTTPSRWATSTDGGRTSGMCARSRTRRMQPTAYRCRTTWQWCGNGTLFGMAVWGIGRSQ